LSKYPLVLREEFIDLYSKSTVKLANSKILQPGTRLIDLDNLA